jgi:His/Glu/Gln/Arg/opine family amino acid ABC transporter permease subunit
MDFDGTVLVRFVPDLLEGLWLTLIALAMTLAVAIILGLAACAASFSTHPLPRAVSGVYVDVFRVVPEIVLIFWIYFCFPFMFDLRMSALTSGVIALALTTGAFLAEVFRAGVLAVPSGQIEAARALALRSPVMWVRIILPQAIRRMLPALVNTVTDLLKHTTLLAGIGFAELTYQAYTLGARTFRYFEFLSAIAVIYFIVIFPLSALARAVERQLRRATSN